MAASKYIRRNKIKKKREKGESNNTISCKINIMVWKYVF